MARIAIVGMVVILFSGFAAGCGPSGATDSPSEKSEKKDSAPKTVQLTPPPSDPAALAAYNFLGAVLRGDDQQVTACLTPTAIQRLSESNKRFPMPGNDSTSFKIGEVRKPSEAQAFVQCMLSDNSKDGQGINDEICCLMRLVDDQWRVSGIAFGTAQGQPAVIDFERPFQAAADMSATPQNQSAPAPVSGRPSPPRTASESTMTPNR